MIDAKIFPNTLSIICPACTQFVEAEMSQADDEQVFWTTSHCGLELSVCAQSNYKEAS